MGSAFGGLTTALSSLYTQRRALELTGQNIANANTEGYTRQRVEMQAVGGTPVPSMHSITNGMGSGVTVSDVARLRDAFLESRGRTEHAQSGYLNAHQEIYTRIEGVFAEPSDTALGAQLDDFWAAWSDVANQPGNEAVRTQLIQRGAVVADGLHTAYEGLNSQWSTLRTQLDAYATDVNTTADAIADLNDAIKQQQAAGLPTNELADQRDVHLMKLAELTGASTVARDDGTVDVFVGGSSLVAGASSRHIAAVGARQMDGQAADRVGFRWGGETGPQVAVSGGRLAAALDILGDTIPGYVDTINDVAVKLADRVNAVHTAGYPLDGTAPAGAFYGSLAGPVTARTITVAITDPRDLGVSTTAGTLDGSNAAALAKVGKQTDGPAADYRSMVVGLGVAAQSAQRRADIQTRITADVDTLRAADAGVNLDEEMTNMITFQRAYEAASRVLNAVDEMLDTLINRTGLVGR